MKALSAMAFLLVAGAASAEGTADPARLELNQVPARAAEVQGFIPAGWDVESRVEGDLDGDHVNDVALLLIPHGFSQQSERSNIDFQSFPAALIIACAHDHAWALCGVNVSFTASNAFPVTLSVEKNVLTATVVGGAGRSSRNDSWKFQWDTHAHAFMAIGESHVDESQSGDAVMTDKRSFNWLTRKATSQHCQMIDSKETCGKAKGQPLVGAAPSLQTFNPSK